MAGSIQRGGAHKEKDTRGAEGVVYNDRKEIHVGGASTIYNFVETTSSGQAKDRSQKPFETL